MYITVFASISSLSLEIEAILFAVNRIQRENLKDKRGKLKTREISSFVYKAMFLQAKEYELMKVKVGHCQQQSYL